MVTQQVQVVETTELCTQNSDLPTTTIQEEPANNSYNSLEEELEAIGLSLPDYILLCNVVAHEYGADWVSVPEKAKVVEVVMNRVASNVYPDTIYKVLTQKSQFSGASTYVNLGTYSKKVTESVKESVLYYFHHLDEFQQGYIGFYGDGRRNYFR